MFTLSSSLGTSRTVPGLNHWSQRRLWWLVSLLYSWLNISSVTSDLGCAYDYPHLQTMNQKPGRVWHTLFSRVDYNDISSHACSSGTLPLPRQALASVSPPLETGWACVAISVEGMWWKWCCVTPRTRLAKAIQFLLGLLSWDTHYWNTTSTQKKPKPHKSPHVGALAHSLSWGPDRLLISTAWRESEWASGCLQTPPITLPLNLWVFQPRPQR